MGIDQHGINIGSSEILSALGEQQSEKELASDLAGFKAG